jgi:HSP20 family protein
MLPINAFDNLFALQREFDRMFNQFWTDLPARTANAQSSFQVQSDDDYWRIDVPLPGIDPKNVAIEVAGNTLAIRAGHAGADTRPDRQRPHYEQTFTVPPFLDIDRISAAHHHGMLQLTIPIKDSVKPRRIQIAGLGDERQHLEGNTGKDQRKQLTTA